MEQAAEECLSMLLIRGARWERPPEEVVVRRLPRNVGLDKLRISAHEDPPRRRAHLARGPRHEAQMVAAKNFGF